MQKSWMLPFIILFVQDLCPAYAASICDYTKIKSHPTKNKTVCRTSRDYVNFSFAPHPLTNCMSAPFTRDDFYNPDLSTGDDDASTYPDMNIDR